MIRSILIIGEITLLSALVLVTRCANYQDVFVGGNIYFTDADCYARMIRVRLCAQYPGLVLRHHDFENFPQGTTPHTTAPFDYLTLGLSILLKPFTAQPIDLAGAIVSPLCGLITGCFLWWWSRKLRFRWVLLILFAISPILVHGTSLGRPDHQSLLIFLIAIALCSEWKLRAEDDQRTKVYWSVVNGLGWGLAIWVSAYEPLVLLGLVIIAGLLRDRKLLFSKTRRVGWICFGIVILLALLVERRTPSLSLLQPSGLFQNWSHTIGELAHVSTLDPIWFRWTGYLVVLSPILIWIAARKRTSPPLFLIILLVTTYLLTMWQARWAYFFVLIFATSLPVLLESFRLRAAVWIAFALSILPILRDWDRRIWPNDAELARRLESRRDKVQLRELAITMMSSQTRPFLAPWWLSPSIAYWSGQPAVAGSSHESLSGIADSARFFLASDWIAARRILEERRVIWVVTDDAERVARNSSAILAISIPSHPVCEVLDRTPRQAASFLLLTGQNGVNKLFEVANNR